MYLPLELRESNDSRPSSILLHALFLSLFDVHRCHKSYTHETDSPTCPDQFSQGNLAGEGIKFAVTVHRGSTSAVERFGTLSQP